jgi:uncharacterized Zn finger protein (UPF0148 family)
MKTVTYRMLDGTSKSFEYDPDAPCVYCGLPVVEASMGGTVVCSWCDCGVDRQGNRISVWPAPQQPMSEESGEEESGE